MTASRGEAESECGGRPPPHITWHCWRLVSRRLPQGERQLDRYRDGDRAAADHPGLESPLFRREQGFFVEAELPVERSRHAHITDAAVRQDDAFEPYRALYLGAHRVGGVLRLHLLNRNRRGNAWPERVHAIADAGAWSIALACRRAVAIAAAAGIWPEGIARPLAEDRTGEKLLRIAHRHR